MRARMTYRFALVTVVCLLVACASAKAQIEPYYSVVSVTSEQLQNSVRIKIDADGAISANINKWLWQSGAEQAGYYLIYDLVKKQTTSEWSPDCYPRVSKILVHLENAMPQLGNVVQVGRYPVSHVRLVVTPEKSGRFGLDVEVVLYKPMRFRKFDFGNWSTWDAYLWDHHDPDWFDVVLNPDKRGLIITVASDRLSESRDHRKLEDTPEDKRELKVSSTDGLLDVHARNAGLAELLEAAGKAAGRRMIAAAGTERVITAELPGVPFEEFAQRVADGYSLVLSGSPDRLVFSDALDESHSESVSGTTESIPVRWMPAVKALSLLPNFLMSYARVDETRNALVVSGPRTLLDKVAADVAKIDQPPIMVELKARLIESSAGDDVVASLALEYAGRDFHGASDPTTGDLTYSIIENPESGFEAKLNALAAAERTRIVADSNIAVLSGETGEVFGGLEKYVAVRPTVWAGEPSLEPVSAGVKLRVTPWAGAEFITLRVKAEVRGIGEVDPATNMPVVDTRMVESSLRLKPGQTILIGGLSRTQPEIVTRKIPILGDLPLVGKLFRRKTTRRVSSELAILLTPAIAKPEARAQADLTLEGTGR